MLSASVFGRFYPDETIARAQLFAQRVLTSSQQVSAAQVQGLFMFNKDDPQAAIDAAGDISGLEYRAVPTNTATTKTETVHYVS